MAQQPIIELKNISFAYGPNEVLHDISFAIEPGDYVGVIGPNGGGKTTLLRLMLGLLEPANGSIKLWGKDVSKFHNWPRLGYVPQKATNFESRLPISVNEVVMLGRVGVAGIGKRLGKHDRQVAAHALAKVGMQDFSTRRITELSGGQQQRVLLAKALAGEPELLILDEPTVGIDSQSQDEFYQLLAQLNRDEGLTLVLVSHDIDVVVNEVTQLACINQGLVYHGQPKEFMKGDYLTQLYGHNRQMIIHGH